MWRSLTDTMFPDLGGRLEDGMYSVSARQMQLARLHKHAGYVL